MFESKFFKIPILVEKKMLKLTFKAILNKFRERQITVQP